MTFDEGAYSLLQHPSISITERIAEFGHFRCHDVQHVRLDYFWVRVPLNQNRGSSSKRGGPRHYPKIYLEFTALGRDHFDTTAHLWSEFQAKAGHDSDRSPKIWPIGLVSNPDFSLFLGDIQKISIQGWPGPPSSAAAFTYYNPFSHLQVVSWRLPRTSGRVCPDLFRPISIVQKPFIFPMLIP